MKNSRSAGLKINSVKSKPTLYEPSHHKMESRQQNKLSNREIEAFMLRDLLALTAILSVLGLLLVPAWASSASRNSRAMCQSNLRKIALAMTLYAGNNHDNVARAGSGLTQIALDPPSTNAATELGLTFTNAFRFVGGLDNTNRGVFYRIVQL